MSPKVYVVIGKNFGDEGKGRVVDDLASGAEGKCLVIRHNGGAQSGHTVIRRSWQKPEATCDEAMEARFVFHELGAGSFSGADTLWIDSFFPDLYKLNEEYAAFHAVSGMKSSIFSMPETPITTIDDVLLNMALEKSRGQARHGSCGMGIYEAFLRTEAGFRITVGDVKSGSVDDLYDRLKRNREEYVWPRVRQLIASAEGESPSKDVFKSESEEITAIDINNCSEIMELLADDNVLMNAAIEMCDAAEKVSLIGVVSDGMCLGGVARDGMCFEGAMASEGVDFGDSIRIFLDRYDRVIFETGQGLLLDSENTEYAPHVTGSRTGLTNPVTFAKRFGFEIDEVVYVTRTYVTRHGAGLLKHECGRGELGIKKPDSTNVTNEWQGDFRYAPHVSINEFLEAPCRDLEAALEISYHNQETQSNGEALSKRRPKVALAVTHLSDTDNRMFFADIRSIDIKEFVEVADIKRTFGGFYLYD